MGFNRKILGQHKPTNTSIYGIVTGEAGVQKVINDIIVCNITGTDATFSVCLDTEATAYDDDTYLFKGEVISANETLQMSFGNSKDSGLPINNKNGALGVKCDAASSCAFLINGIESRQ